MTPLNTPFRLKILSLIFFSLTLVSCFEPPPYNNLDNQQLQTLLDKGTPIIDIRRPDEWRQTGVIKSSQLLTFVDSGGRLSPGFLQKFTAQYDKNEPVIVICQTGGRTDSLARHLVEKMGYKQVYNVRHGISDWISNGLKVTQARL